MAKLSKQLKTMFSEWQDNIRKEIDRIEEDNAVKVDEILALKHVIRENEDELSAIENNVRDFATEMLKIARDAFRACDYAACVADTLDKIKDYDPNEDDDEDEEPVAYCEACGAEIWDEDEIVSGEYGEYCCDECLEEAEDEEDDEDEEQDEDEEV